MSLRELQRGMRAALLGSSEEAAAFARTHLAAPGADPAGRLEVHRNNLLIGLAGVVAAAYPVVGRLVGEAFLDVAAKAFSRAHPPRAGSLIDYGDAFPEFLAAFPPAAGLPYLADVARLEWARHEAYHGPEARPLRPAALADRPLAEVVQRPLPLHPTARLLRSPYPVERIWRANRDGPATGRIDLADGGCRLLVVRPHAEVEVRPLAEPDWLFLRALAEGRTVTEAMERAIDLAGPFDFAAVLSAALAGNVFRDDERIAP